MLQYCISTTWNNSNNIIFITNTIHSFWRAILQQKNTIQKECMVFVSICSGLVRTETLLVRMKGTEFMVSNGFFLFQKVSLMTIIEPFPTIYVFFYFNHIFAYFPLIVYKACTLFAR